MPYFVPKDQIPFYYKDEGPRSDSAIFLIHGEPSNSKFWQKNIPTLSKQHRVISMDIRGRGESGKTNDGQYISQYARDFRYLLEQLGFTRIVTVGWSMGISIFWSYIQQYGEEFIAGFLNVEQEPYRFFLR